MDSISAKNFSEVLSQKHPSIILLDVSSISRNCRKLCEHGGKDENGNNLYWQYAG